MDDSIERDKPWRPADHPRPGPSWDPADRSTTSEHKGVPDGED